MTSSPMRSPASWLELALRHRQRLLDDQAPALRAALEDERRGDQALDSARRDLEAAHRAQSVALLAAALPVELLRLHGAYAGRLRGALDTAAATAQHTRAASQVLRSRAAHDLSERDAFQQRLADLALESRAEERRVEARNVDEIWLLTAGAYGDAAISPCEGPHDAD
jgi:hypothetical protein